MVEPGPDMAALVERVRQGDEDAARALVEALHPLVLRLVRANKPRRTSEEDLLQNVFLKVFSRLDQYAGAVPIEHWVARITVNTCLNQLKHERVRPELRWADLTETEEEVVRNLASPGGDVPPGQELAARDLVERLLEHLSVKDRLLMTLIYLEEKTVAETAHLLGWNVTLVKVRTFRARRRLRQYLDDLLNELPARRTSRAPGV